MLNYKEMLERIRNKIRGKKVKIDTGASPNWPGAGGSLPAGASLPCEWIMPSSTSLVAEIELKPSIQCSCGNKIEIVAIVTGSVMK